MRQAYVDLSHTIEEGMITYRGLPAPLICDFLSREDSETFYEKGTRFQIGKIEMVANTGTYLDCPFHRYEDGKDLSEVLLEKMADLEGVLISVPGAENFEIGVSHLKGKVLTGKAVLIHTGWSKYWRTERYFENYPFVSREAALFLKEQKVKLVGIDALNIDDTRGRGRPVHSILLREEILIVEHLTNLDKLIDQAFLFSAVPPKIKGMGSFPVRAYAKLKNGL